MPKPPKNPTQVPAPPPSPLNEEEILARLARIGEGGRRPLRDFLAMTESVGEEDLKTVKNFLFNLFCQIYDISRERMDTEEGRLLRLTADVAVLKPADTIAYALHLMATYKFRHIPLVDDDGKPCGVVSFRSVVDYLEAYFSPNGGN